MSRVINFDAVAPYIKEKTVGPEDTADNSKWLTLHKDIRDEVLTWLKDTRCLRDVALELQLKLLGYE